MKSDSQFVFPVIGASTAGTGARWQVSGDRGSRGILVPVSEVVVFFATYNFVCDCCSDCDYIPSVRRYVVAIATTRCGTARERSMAPLVVAIATTSLKSESGLYIHVPC